MYTTTFHLVLCSYSGSMQPLFFMYCAHQLINFSLEDGHANINTLEPYGANKALFIKTPTKKKIQ